MAPKLRIAIGLVFLAIFLTSVVAVPLAVAQSSSPEELRCRIVKRTPRCLVVKHSHPRVRLVIRHGQRDVTLHRDRHFRVVRVTRQYVVLRAARPQAVKSLSVSAPTGSGSYAVGANLTVSWTTGQAASAGEFGVWARSAAGGWYVAKLVPASGGSSFSTSLALDVPTGSGYQAIVAWRARAGSGSWGRFGTSPGAFSVVAPAPAPTPTPTPAPTPTPTPTPAPTPTPMPVPTVTPTPMPTPTPTVTPSPTPTVTPSPTPTVTPSPTPTVTPIPNAAHPRLVLTADDILAIRAAIAKGEEPVSSSYRSFMQWLLPSALQDSPNVYLGPYTGGDLSTMRQVFDRLSIDGGRARDVGIAYALTDNESCAAKTREYLMAWATGNTPTSYNDAPMSDTGQLQSYGAFSFAYAYDLTYNSSVYSDADRAVITSYFRRFASALQTCHADTLDSPQMNYPDDYSGTYTWDSSKHFSIYDWYVGSNFVLLIQAASLGLAYDADDQQMLDVIMTDQTNVLRVDNAIKHALSPRNDGDGQGTTPVPQVQVLKQYVEGRGGMFDYMTYSTRIAGVLVQMGDNLGYDMTTSRARLRTSWTYMARFFGPGAQPNFNPLDQVNLDACLPRFALAYKEFGDQRFLDILRSGYWPDYWEPQLLGPIMVTHTVR